MAVVVAVVVAAVMVAVVAAVAAVTAATPTRTTPPRRRRYHSHRHRHRYHRTPVFEVAFVEMCLNLYFWAHIPNIVFCLFTFVGPYPHIAFVF